MRQSFAKSLALIAVVAIAACSRVDRLTGPAERASDEADSGRAGAALFAPNFANLTGPVPSPEGLRACFAGENNANDVVSNNVGVVVGASFAAGRFGDGFDFTGPGQGIDVPASASLNVGASASGMTIGAWVYGRGTMFQPGSGITGAGPIVEFNEGAHMWQHSQQNDPSTLFTNLAEGTAPEQWHIVQTENTLFLGAWHHAAVTYDKASGRVKLYVDGVMVADSVRGTFTPNTTTPFHIGSRVTAIIGASDFTFNGSIDEVQLYDRALTDAEVGQLSSATGTMCVAPPAAFFVAQLPVGSGESGVPFTTQPVVEIRDASGNVVANATTPVTATVVSGSGTLLGTTTVNAVNGVATFTDLAIAGVGTTTIGFSVGSLPPASGSPVVSPALITVQTPDRLGIATQPGGAQSGALLTPQPVIEIRDAAGLLVPGTTAAITATIASGDGTLGGTTTVVAAGGVASFTDLTITGSGGPVTLAFAAAGLTGVVSGTFNIAGLAATQLVLVVPPSGTAESGTRLATQPVVELRDVNNSLATSATGTVTVSIATGAGGALTGTTTVSISDGRATFTDLQINGPGTFTLGFAFGALPPTASPPIQVTQFVRKLAIIAEPTSIADGVPMLPPYTIELRDSADIKVSTSTYLLRMSLISGTGTLTGTNEVNAVAGVTTFDNVVVHGSGPVAFNFWVIEESAFPNWAFTLSGSVPVVAREATELGIVTQPAGAESGIPIETQPVVEVRDAYGRVPTTGGTVNAAIFSGTGGTLLGTATAPVVDGVATFGNLQINGAGSFVLRFTSGTLAAVNSAPLQVVQKVNSVAIIGGPGTITTGVTMTPPFAIELRDAAGLPMTSSTLQMTMSVASGTGALSGGVVKNAVGGVVTYDATVYTGPAGVATFSFQVTDPAALPLQPSVVSGAVNVLAAPPPPPPTPPFPWGGFKSPVDNPPTVNAVQAGSTVPVKFSLGGNQGMNIFVAGHPASQPASCTTWAPTGASVPIADAASIAADLRYAGNHYQINWTTNKAFKDSCRLLVLKLTDGSTHTARFSFK